MKAQGIISILVGIVGLATFTALLIVGKIGALGYTSLLSLLAIVCIVIPVLGRLKELDLKNLKLTLQKIEEAKKDIYAKEESLRAASLALSELIAANATLSGILGDDESNAYSEQLIRVKLKKLATMLNFTTSDVELIFKYQRALDDLHSATKDETKEKRVEKWNKFKEFLKSETDNNA